MHKKSQHFSHTASAKCLLFGAHAVLRGKDALACSLTNYTLTLQWSSYPHELNITGIHCKKLQKLFLSFLSHACTLCQISADNLKGKLHLQTNIPIGSNLGSSAAICIAISKLFVHLQYIEANEEHVFSKQCENFFHGLSSGLDILASNCPKKEILLWENNIPKTQKIIWKPTLYLLATPSQANTREAITKVTQWSQQNPVLAKKVDEDMHHCTHQAYQAMAQTNLSSYTRHQKFQQAVLQACRCYKTWGLIPKKTEAIIQKQYQLGALAITPVGGGDGGHILIHAPSNNLAYQKNPDVIAI